MKNKLQILTIALVTLIFTNGYSATRTWSGATNQVWTLAANWGGTAPAAGDSLVIPASGITNYPSSSIGGTYLSLTVLSGTLTFTNNITLTGTLTLNGGNVTTTGRTVTVKNLTLTSGTYTHGANVTFSGTLTLNGGNYALGSTARTLSAANIRVNSGTFSLPSPHILTATASTTFNGGSINLNGNTFNTPSPTFTSGSITSTNVNSNLVITGTHTASLISNLTRGLITYTNLTVSTNQTLTDTIAITGNLTLSGNTFNTAGFLSTIGGDITVSAASTLKSTGVSKIEIGSSNTLTMTSGSLTLDNVELIIDRLVFGGSAGDVQSLNGGFLAYNNSSNHNVNSTLAKNASHVNAKFRLYTASGNTDSIYFPVGDGSVYAPFMFRPVSVPTGGTAYTYYVDVTYVGAKASQSALDNGTGSGVNSTLLHGASGYEYWTVSSSHTTITGQVGLRYDNNSSKTGKTVVNSVTNLSANLKLTQFNTTSNKWVGIPSANRLASNITSSFSTSTTINPTSNWTLASATSATTFTIALPVTLINFDAVANKTNKSVEVRWATATEENNSHFEIMHSTDFVNWTSIGTVYSKGNGNDMNVYSFTDINPSTVNNYKLKIVALNGEVSYSNIKLVKFTETVSTTVNVYPNPANANVNLSVDNMDMSTPVTIQLVNPMGQVVFEQIITENLSGMMNTSIPTSEFAAGIYQVTISGTTGTVSQKLIINH